VTVFNAFMKELAQNGEVFAIAVDPFVRSPRLDGG
jgi:hypothetical protein